MEDFISRFFDTSDFPPRWHCGNWTEFLGWLHIASDLATWAAYFTIPVVLIYFARKRQDFPFTRLFWLFAIFILACGTVHLIEAVIFWLPIYRISALVKFLTAIVSWATVLALLRIVPQAMHLPSLAATNQKLLDQEQQLRSLFSSTAEGIYGIDLDGRCTFANEACAKLLGFDATEELLGRQMHLLVHHSHADGTPYPVQDCPIFRAYRQNERIHVDNEVFWHKDETSFDVEYWSHPQMRGNELVGCVVTFIDITKRKHRERSLAFLADLQSSLFGITSEDDIIRATSERVADYLKLSHFMLIEMDEHATRATVVADHCRNDAMSLLGVYEMSDFATHSERMQLANGRPMVVNDAGDVSRSQQFRESFSSLEIGAILNTPSNRGPHLQFMLSCTKAHAYAWREDEIELVRQLANIIVLKLDRAQAEAAMLESRARLRNAAKAAGFGTIHAHITTGRVTYSEELRRLIGLDGGADEAVPPESILDCVHPDDRDACVQHYRELMRSPDGRAGSLDCRIVRPGGEFRWVRLQATPRYIGTNEARQIFQIIGTVVDITQQREYEHSLDAARKDAEAANESKSEFVANMSHEIRTPMTAVLGYADLLIADENDPQKMNYLQTIKRNGRFLLDIINDILDVSKIEAGKMEILKERFPVQAIVDDVRSMMDVRAKEKALDFFVEYEDRIPAEIESDPKRLKQILVNLIGNAIKFTESGSVTLKVRYLDRNGGLMLFEVQDTGIGVTPEQQQRLFQPFSQGDASVTRSFGGTGLGLAISRRLALVLGGDIELRTASGPGSTFAFEISVGDIDGVRLITPLPPPKEENNATKTECHLNCHVLIVDDRRDVRFLSQRLLTKAGATVTEAEDGQEALEIIRALPDINSRFAVVLMDMQMPRLDGYQAARALRKMGFSKPIIALTADAMQGDMNRCLESGCNDYLSKPIDATALLEMVRKYTQ